MVYKDPEDYVVCETRRPHRARDHNSVAKGNLSDKIYAAVPSFKRGCSVFRFQSFLGCDSSTSLLS